MSNQAREAEGQLSRAQDLKLEAERRNDGLRREVDILSQDKGFLQRDNHTLEERVKVLEDKLDRSDQ